MAKVFINGAGGFFGAHFVEHFMKQGHKVSACGRPSTDLSIAEAAGANILRADVTDPQSLASVIKGHDVVINVAGIFDMSAKPEVLDRVNHLGTRNVCEAIKETKVKRLVQISTVGVYGPASEIPCHENCSKNANTAYGKTKWAGEQVAYEYGNKFGFEVTALRPTLVYGPRAHYGHAMWLAYFIVQKYEGKNRFPLINTGPVSQNVHIADVCRAAELVAFHKDAAGESFNVVDDSPVTLKEFMMPLLEGADMTTLFEIPYYAPLWKVLINSLLFILPTEVKFINGMIKKSWDKLYKEYGLKTPFTPRLDKEFMAFLISDMVFDNSKIKSLGFEFQYPDYKKGMDETIQWYKKEKWIP